MDATFTWPMAIRFTPHHTWRGRTEFSASFDSLCYDHAGHFGDRATLAATCVVRDPDGDKLDIAIAPQLTYLLRGDNAARAGATAIARYATNPAGTFDLGAGYGFRLKPSGPLGHLTPHMNWLYEKSTGNSHQVSLFEGMEYQVTEPSAIDSAVQHISLWGNRPDTQFVVGLTVNTGRLRRH